MKKTARTTRYATLLSSLLARTAVAAPDPAICPANMPPPAELPPVVLVGGSSGGMYFEDLARQMAACGWENDRIFRYYRQATGCVAEEAAILNDYMNGVLATTGSDVVDVMGYSLGGTLVRWWLAFHGGVDHVDEVVLWAAPNNGSPYTQEDDPYCWMREIREGTEVIQCLNGVDSTCGNPYTVAAPFAAPNTTPPDQGIAYYNLWSGLDGFLPKASTDLAGAISVKTPAVVHTDFHRNAEIRRLTMQAFLRREAVTKTASSGCGAMPGSGPAEYALLALGPAALLLRRRRAD